MIYLLLFAFGILIGVMGGLLGIGGGIAMVPGLIMLFGFSQAEAQGTSLAVMVPPISIFAAMVYYQHGYIRGPVVFWVATGFVFGAYAGAKLLPHVPAPALRLAFGMLLLYVGFLFVQAPRSKPAAAMPAALATLGTALLARWRQRRRDATSPSTPPGDDIEYHI